MVQARQEPRFLEVMHAVGQDPGGHQDKESSGPGEELAQVETDSTAVDQGAEHHRELRAAFAKCWSVGSDRNRCDGCDRGGGGSDDGGADGTAQGHHHKRDHDHSHDRDDAHDDSTQWRATGGPLTRLQIGGQLRAQVLEGLRRRLKRQQRR